uniref:Methyltransferase type 11 domain-containing protein n=1 Tax=Chrysotila carterae TaxID=13221 RepID=A0A7S4FBV9_CHRCT|mmetsp:Transcript_22943/g.50187  ORF Transcript_22943/g.50187 Transcript_22943/m.50187 type:complete len:341 (+) Transcript_22943:156-1178(+)|eukprot:3720407-Pleurochrysis_carterae.AAC.1
MNAAYRIQRLLTLFHFLVCNLALDLNDEASCQALFRNKSEAAFWPPPKTIPPELLSSYSMNGSVKVFDWYLKHKANGRASTWHVPAFKKYIHSCRQEVAEMKENDQAWILAPVPKGPKTAEASELAGTDSKTVVKKPQCECYGSHVCLQTLLQFQSSIQGSRVIIIGSQSFWAEAHMVAFGASYVVTYEYQQTLFDAPLNLRTNWSYVHPSDAASQYLSGQWEPVDIAFSFSSLEHDGLGRYGDPLNPDGDLQSIQKVACLMRPGGLFFLGLPSGYDAVVWNAHRIYGSHRLQQVFNGWELVTFVGVVDTFNKPDNTKTFNRPSMSNSIVYVMRKPKKQA